MEHIREVAKKVQKIFPRFCLGDGTAIMLKYNHRVSIDLDFFCEEPFSFNHALARARKYLNIDRFNHQGDNLDLYVDGIKVSLIIFPFPNLMPVIETSGIIMMDDYDIFLNKVYAAGRRIVWKDPYDAAFLWKLHKWPVSKVKADFERKFLGQSREIFLGALLDFDSYPELSEETVSVLRELEKAVEKEGGINFNSNFQP